jgi:hypothetical protein
MTDSKLGKSGVCLGTVFFVIISQMLFICLLSGCSQSQNNAGISQQMKFEVIDSLLGTEYIIPNAGICIRPPVNFSPISDSLLSRLQSKLKEMFGDSEKIELQQFLMDKTNGAGMMISTIQGLSLTSDTAIFMSRFRGAIDETYNKINVKSGDYWIGDIYIKNFLIMDSLNIRFQLLCFPKENTGFELQYFSNRKTYPQLIKSIESSIGSLKPIQLGGQE